jgi:hypothetical protein
MESLRKTNKVVDEIIVDPNFQLSEDAKFGHELAKNPAEWYRYFNQPLPKDSVRTSVFDDEEFDNLFK